ncbi:MAG: tRNA (adenosine(37)-N6)-threonylcarbamoyltransferase complex dimerization subunit type 1 TsaB, partial [Pseudomonadota bacterium]
MIVLGLDTALASCSVAILRGGAKLFENFTVLEKGHAEALPLMAAKALEEARIAPADLDRIGVVIGPGQFAGVRVGLAFARGLALGQKAKVIGVDTLRALHASHAIDGAMTAVAVDARRGEVFAALYGRAGEVIIAPFAATPGGAAERLRATSPEEPPTLIGSGAPLLSRAGFLAPDAPAQGWSIDASAVARFAAAAAPTAAS